MNPQQWRGFTLVELLVVIALIALLTAFLFPVFARTRGQARQIACMNNLKQIACAARLYLQDNDERFPPNGTVYIRDLRDLDQLWFRQLRPYLKSDGVLHCPADNVSNAQRAFSDGLPAEHDRPGLPALSYGANWDLMTAAALDRPEANIAALPSPELTLLVADCTEPWAFGPVFTDRSGTRWSHIAYANGPAVFETDNIYYHGGRSGSRHERHGAGSHVAFCDGHVAFLAAERFYRNRELRPVGVGGRPKKVLVQWPVMTPAAVPWEGRGSEPTAVPLSRG